MPTPPLTLLQPGRGDEMLLPSTEPVQNCIDSSEFLRINLPVRWSNSVSVCFNSQSSVPSMVFKVQLVAPFSVFATLLNVSSFGIIAEVDRNMLHSFCFSTSALANHGFSYLLSNLFPAYWWKSCQLLTFPSLPMCISKKDAAAYLKAVLYFKKL